MQASANSLRVRNPLRAPSSGVSTRPVTKGRAPLRCNAAAGRGVVVLPGLGNASGDYDDLVAQLEARDHTVAVARVARYDWLRNAAGLTKASYWKGTLTPRPTVDWYLERISAAVEEVKEQTGGDSVCLLAHSAGGWMSRVWMKEYGSVEDVHTLLCLGSPLQPPPEGANVIDQTRGILTYVTTNIPGAYHDSVRYVCINGNFIEGKELGEEGTLTEKVTGLGYKQVYGSASVWGDGITPVPVGSLEGAECVTLDGVYHSPLGAGEGRPWYGTEGVTEQWAGYLEPPKVGKNSRKKLLGIF